MRESGSPQQENNRQDDNKDYDGKGYNEHIPNPGLYFTDYPEEDSSSELI